MKKRFYSGVIAVMLLASPLVGAEDKYPASDFKPKVVYQDTEYKPEQSSGQSTATRATATDSKYPASNFEPKVLYKDAGYKPGPSSTARPSNTATSTTTAAANTNETVSTAAADTESETDYSLGLVALVLVGLFFFFNKRGAKSPAKKPSRNVSQTSGLTGVARYLQDVDGSSAVSGVARYLEKKELTSATGVAKYMAKQAVAAKESASSQLSGVEKYLRDRG